MLSRMQEDEADPADGTGRPRTAGAAGLRAYSSRLERDIGFHFVKQVARETESVAGIEAITANSTTVRSTIDPALQRAVETALQEGLSRDERSAGRAQPVPPRPSWPRRSSAPKRSASSATSGRLAGGAGERAVAASTCTGRPRRRVEASGKKGEAWRVGLADGRVLPLSIDNAAAQRKLALYDVVLVRVTEGKGKTAARAELRVRPVVQGAVVVLENKTGRILAMSGGFSYPLSQLGRTTQAVRQPGSAIKPLSISRRYAGGYSPTPSSATTRSRCRPLAAAAPRAGLLDAEEHDSGGGGILTLRRALENSRNLATVGCSTAASRTPRRRASIASASSRWKRISTANASILSVRARCPAGAADRSGGVLRHHRERGAAARPMSSSRSSATVRRSIDMTRNPRSR